MAIFEIIETLIFWIIETLMTSIIDELKNPAKQTKLIPCLLTFLILLQCNNCVWEPLRLFTQQVLEKASDQGQLKGTMSTQDLFKDMTSTFLS